ncbi:MAG: hypothetical protein R2939_13420 [Kofleriaceae bacterium]
MSAQVLELALDDPQLAAVLEHGRLGVDDARLARPLGVVGQVARFELVEPDAIAGPRAQRCGARPSAPSA